LRLRHFGVIKQVSEGMNPQKKKNLRIKRETAGRILKKMVQTAEEINSAPETQFMYFVSKVVVFGSYLTEKERLGDIDVAVEIEGRWKTGEEFNRLLEAVCETKLSGVPDVLYPYQKIITTLRNRSKSLSFHPIEEIVRGNFPHKIIFERNHQRGSNCPNVPPSAK
jgi:predicted nucleotidyltransferase